MLPREIACFYVDLGRPYAPLIERMTRTARVAMPDARLVLITGKQKVKEAQFFDVVVEMPFDPAPATVCYDKARCIASWATKTDRSTIFIDPDVEFLKPIPFITGADIALLWRDQKPAQPVNAGMIMSQPGLDEFWMKYLAIAGNLPRVLRQWWCDQLALSVLLGSLHKAGDLVQVLDASVQLLDPNIYCAKPEDATSETLALHWKGTRKGDGWEQYFTTNPMHLGTAA